MKGNPTKSHMKGKVIASGENIKVAKQHPMMAFSGKTKSRTARAYSSASHTLKAGCV